MTKGVPQFIIVDDDAINNMFCKFSIKKYFSNADIQTFQRPEMALAMIVANYPLQVNTTTILFLDINMPTMNGWEFLDAFSQFDVAVRTQFVIYILSSSIKKSDIERAGLSHFVSEYLSKPLTGPVTKRLLSTFINIES